MPSRAATIRPGARRPAAAGRGTPTAVTARSARAITVALAAAVALAATVLLPVPAAAVVDGRAVDLDAVEASGTAGDMVDDPVRAAGVPTPYIVAGTPTPAGRHRYVAFVALFESGEQEASSACTGVLVDPRWVLTAAHCVEASDGAVVFLDMVDIDDGGAEQFGAVEAVIAPAALETDLALLRLDGTSAVPPVTVAGDGDDGRFLGGTDTLAVGWGDVDGGGTWTDVLRQGDIDLFSVDACYDAIGGGYDHASLLCGGGVTHDTCVGDSGGPMLARDGGVWVAIGITSFGDAACDPEIPSAYARVSHARAWIEDVTGLSPGRGDVAFSDLTRHNRHFEAVMQIVEEGIAAGYADGTYGPDRDVTRGQMAAFLARGLGLSADDPPPYDDVPSDHEHASAIAAVSEAGIALGYGDGTFRPGARVSRAQMATFLTRGLDLPSAGPPPYDDVPSGSEHAGAVAAVTAAGIASGHGDGSYRPDAPVARDQMGSFLARGLGLVVSAPS